MSSPGSKTVAISTNGRARGQGLRTRSGREEFLGDVLGNNPLAGHQGRQGRRGHVERGAVEVRVGVGVAEVKV